MAQFISDDDGSSEDNDSQRRANQNTLEETAHRTVSI